MAKAPALQVVLEAEPGLWGDLAEKREAGTLVDAREADAMTFATVRGGMASGLPLLMVRIDLPDGRTIVAQTSVAALLAAARLVAGRHAQEIEAGRQNAQARDQAAQQGGG